MGFDGISAFYGLMETVCAGRLMQKARTAWLDACPEDGHVLLAGEGHGKTMAALRRLRPDLHLTWLDASAGMEQRARRRMAQVPGGRSRVNFVRKNVQEWEPGSGPPVAVIITPFFLDCFTAGELDTLIPRLTGATHAGALWLIADFQMPPSGWRRQRARLIHFLLHLFFRRAAGISAYQWTDPDFLLTKNGWSLKSRRTFSHGLVRSDLWEKAVTNLEFQPDPG